MGLDVKRIWITYALGRCYSTHEKNSHITEKQPYKYKSIFTVTVS